MATVESDDRKRFDEWITGLLGGSGRPARSPALRYEARDRAVAEMRTVGAERVFPLFVPMLTGQDPEARCMACETVLRVDAHRAFDLVLPLLDDPEVVVRWHACGCLHDFGDERAVPALVEVLRRDPDPSVRGTAAYALGGIGSPAGIPALLAALGSA